MNIYAGTSGFSYKEWQGPFYPEKIKPTDMLPYYAERLPAVEINNTFYRMPKKDLLEGWRDRTPEGFRFVLKASRKITHIKKLADTQLETQYLTDTVRVLGDRLGALLIQLPPYLRKGAERLSSFLDTLPADIRYALEFRHESWFDDEIMAILKSHNAALCVADTDDSDGQVTATADWGYLRLRRADYSDADLEKWAAAVAGQPWSEVFVFFKHEDEGAGPRMAGRFLEIAGSQGQ